MNNHHIAIRWVIVFKSAQTWTKSRFLIFHGLTRFRHSEWIFNSSHKLAMINISCSNHINIFSHIVTIMIFLNHISRNRLHIANISQNRQSDLLSLENTTMRNLYCRLQGHRFASLHQLSFNSTPLIINVLSPIKRIGEHIANYSDSVVEILLKGGYHIRSVFSWSVSV